MTPARGLVRRFALPWRSRRVVGVTAVGVAVTMTATAASAAATAGARQRAVGVVDGCPWVTSTAPVAKRVDQLLKAMTLADKIQELHGVAGSSYAGYTPAIPRLCVPALRLEDGPGGVGDAMKGVTQLPAPVANAAAWSPPLARAYGRVVGVEQWGKGVNVDLGPTVNIVRDPRWGRAFETYGEDPYLNGQIGAAEIRGVQSSGTLAQVKHWAVYNQETNRNTPADNAIIGPRALNEIYAPAFRAAVRQGGVASVMCSYATINGTYACENPSILSRILRDRWHFPGFVTSDWGGTHSTIGSVRAGLNQEMPDGQYFGAPLRRAVERGRVSTATLDSMVRPILAEMFRFDLFTRQQTGTPSSVVTTPAHAAVSQQVAEQGSVLLKNSGRILPLSSSTTHSIAVIGADGGPHAVTTGGGSARVTAPSVVTPYQGIAHRAGHSVRVRYAQGNAPDGELPAVPSDVLTPSSGTGSGLTGRYYDGTTLSGSPAVTRNAARIRFDWSGRAPAVGMPASQWSARWTGTLTPPRSGRYTFSLASDDGGRLLVNGQPVIDNWRDQASDTETGTVSLTAGEPVSIEVDYVQYHGTSLLDLGWQPPGGGSLVHRAVEVARSSDVAVVFASDFESEGSDLRTISLPSYENSLISAVAAANPHTIVVLNTGSAVTMPWLDRVRGVVEAWYPGQRDGDAIAALLFGDVDPSGKLPVTFPRSLADVPASTAQQWPGGDGRVSYSEGLDVGYRWYEARHIQPLFPFGYGLSYTRFSFGDLRVARGAGGTVDVSASVTNTGARTGSEVAQLYVHDPASAGEPPIQLRGFQRVTLRPGRRATVRFTLRRDAFQVWNTSANTWQVTGGDYQLMIGDSSVNLPLRAGVTLPPSR